MIEALQQNFVSPIGLTALLALIPLIIFYLVKPKPQKEVMPSMAFFTEEQKSGKIKSALERLRRNRMLLLHIFLISLLGLAIANPLIPGLESRGESVIILDNSASMHDNRQEAEKFALNHVGERNTIISTSPPEILVREASTQEARDIIRNYKNSESGTYLVSAVQLASNYDGKLVLASDIDHTGDRKVLPLLEGMTRSIETVDLNQENSHGFIDLEVGGEEAEVTLQNFKNRDRTIEIQKPGENREVNVSAQSTKTVAIELGSGPQEISLPPDEFALDNNLHISMPENRTVQVANLGEESQYFREAVRLINFTEYSEVERIGGADTYFIRDDYELNSMRHENLRNEIEDGKTVIIEDREDLPEIAPVENSSGTRSTQVRVSAGMSTNFNSTVRPYDVEGETLAQPGEALVLSEDEDVLLYNVVDERFGQRINYPIFWKQTVSRMNEVKSGSEQNLRTGQEKNFENPVRFRGQQYSGLNRLEGTGFYRGENTYGVNLLNSDESSPNVNSIASRGSFKEKTVKNPGRKYLAALLALLASLEITYLSWRGELK
jgi:hypothetical protein